MKKYGMPSLLEQNIFFTYVLDESKGYRLRWIPYDIICHKLS